MAFRKTLQVAAWLLLFAIAALSILSPSYRIVTILPQPIEHLVAFLLTGLTFSLAYPSRYGAQSVAFLLFTVGVELAQLWIPGRHARLSDMIVNLLGLGTGIGLGYIMTRWLKAAGGGAGAAK